MLGRDRTGARTVVLVVVLIVVGFVAASVASMRRLTGIERSAAVIATNAVPSIEELVAARRSLTAITAAVDATAHGAPLEPLRGYLRASRDELGRHVDRYLALPPYAGEREAWAEVRTSMGELDRVLGAILRAPSGPELAVLRVQMAPLVARIDRVLLSIIDLNARQIGAFAREINEARVAAWRDLWLLTGAVTVLAVLLLGWARRVVRARAATEQRAQDLLTARVAELDVFAQRVAHDLVAPLTPSKMWLEKLRESPDTLTQYAASRALRGVERASSLVQALLAFARAHQRQQQGASADVEAVARDVLDGFESTAASAGATLALESSGAALVAVPPGIVASVLGNLVQNAIAYPGAASERRVTIALLERDGRVRVEVRDTGPGVPAALEGRIFEPYFRAAAHSRGLGLGLGLATAKTLVEAYDGAIGVASTGEGSTFWFELPSVRREPGAGRAA